MEAKESYTVLWSSLIKICLENKHSLVPGQRVMYIHCTGTCIFLISITVLVKTSWNSYFMTYWNVDKAGALETEARIRVDELRCRDWWLILGAHYKIMLALHPKWCFWALSIQANAGLREYVLGLDHSSPVLYSFQTLMWKPLTLARNRLIQKILVRIPFLLNGFEGYDTNFLQVTWERVHFWNVQTSVELDLYQVVTQTVNTWWSHYHISVITWLSYNTYQAILGDGKWCNLLDKSSINRRNRLVHFKYLTFRMTLNSLLNQGLILWYATRVQRERQTCSNQFSGLNIWMLWQLRLYPSKPGKE